ncbi:SPX domain-containing protein [Dactylonectria estremocensis]|uniref:SPX domain-containing protein n=1 Tax=Dactylonectria estremocensis TaxID=1079267 RepID=A0A9P9F1V2_9HYPO|nr:SPX domain-containing protein [Dactylonectria estremocensis]
MKFGEQLERESVPEWSLHNLDYNSLKHEIKVHTTRHQGVAMTIPGHQDEALTRFEDGLYMELGHQHDRLHLFVSSKADEISRRLEHLAKSIYRWIRKPQEDMMAEDAIKFQRRFAKYERELVRCGGDIQALSRFTNAQVVAFRKILKKYKKWTGSTTLTARFNDNILSDPKSFTRRDFSHLQERYDEITDTLRVSTPILSEPSSPESVPQTFRTSSHSCSSPPDHNPRSACRPQPFPQPQFDVLPPPKIPSSQVKYWNEYDDGSECGADDEYAIYINPEESMAFPGLDYLQGIFKIPLDKARGWFKLDYPAEEEPLLAANHSPREYSATNLINDSDEEGGYASSDGFPAAGYATHYALPSLSQQAAARYRESAFFWGTVGCFFASFTLLAIAGTLISTGKHKLRAEVDAGVTVGVVTSLFSACSALGMTMYRRDPLPLTYQLVVWGSFTASCLLNGMLLILVVGNAP